MASEDKVVKIKISTDDSSVYKFKSMIESMTASVQKLASTLDKVTRSLEGFNKAQGKGGKPNVGPTTTPGGKSGGIAETILGGGDGSGVNNAARATEKALQSTGENIKRFVDKAIQDITRLNQATKGAGQGPSYSGWTSSTGAYGGGGGGAGPGYSGFEREIVGVEPPGGGSKRHRGGFWTGRRSIFNPGEVMDDEASASKLWGPRGFAGYAEGRGQALGRMLGLPTGGQNMLGNAGKAIGGSVGLVGGVALGGAALWNYGAGAFEDVRPAQIAFTQNSPFIKRQAASAGLGLFREQFDAAQSGSVSRVMAFRKAMSDPEVMKSINSTQLDKELLMNKFSQSPLSLGSAYKKGKDWLQNVASEGFQSAAQGLSFMGLFARVQNASLTELPAEARKSILDLGMAQAYGGLTEDKVNKLRQAARFEELRQDPRTAMMADRIYGGAEGRLNTARMAGRGVGFNKDGGLKYELWESRLKRGGWSPENEAAGHQQLLQIGAGYSKAVDPVTLGALGMAGLTSAGSIAQMGGILGGSVGAGSLKSGLLGQLQKSIGSGGLDVAVGRDLFSTLGSQMIQSGSWGAGNTGASALNMAASMVGMVDANGHSTIDVAQQQRMMGLYSQSNATLGSFTKGTGAPIYNAMSTLNAIAATGGKYGIDTENLRAMDPTLLLAIANGAAVPSFYGEGINQESAKKFLRLSAPMGLSTFADKNLVTSGPNRDLMNRIRAEEGRGGSIASMIKGETSGWSTAATNVYTMNVASRYAGMIARGNNMSPEQALSSLLPVLQSEGLYTTRLNGGGVGVAGPAGLEKLSLEEKAKILNKEGNHFEKTDRKGIEDAFSQMLESQDADRLAIKAVGGSAAGDIEAVSNGLITAIQAYGNWFKAHGGSGSGAPIKASPKGGQKGGRETSNGMKRVNGHWE